MVNRFATWVFRRGLHIALRRRVSEIGLESSAKNEKVEIIVSIVSSKLLLFKKVPIEIFYGAAFLSVTQDERKIHVVNDAFWKTPHLPTYDEAQAFIVLEMSKAEREFPNFEFTLREREE